MRRPNNKCPRIHSYHSNATLRVFWVSFVLPYSLCQFPDIKITAIGESVARDQAYDFPCHVVGIA